MQKIDAADLKVSHRNILVWGPVKTFKTRFAGTAPKPIRYYDLDWGALSLAGDAKPGEIDLRRFANKSADKIGKTQERTSNREVFLEFVDDFNQIFDLPEDKRPKTVVVDSLTELGNMCMEFVLSMNNRSSPVFQDWGQAMEKIKEVVRAGVALPCNFILIAHEQTDKDEVLGSIRTDPMIFGKLAGEIGRFFDDVFHSQMEKVVVDSKPVNEARFMTSADGLIKAAGTRSSGTMPRLVKPEWTAIYGALGK